MADETEARDEPVDEDVLAPPTRTKGPSPVLTFLRKRVVRRAVASLIVAVLGAGVGVALGGTVQHKVGPVEASFRLRFDTAGGTRVGVPPLGNISLRDHAGPLRLRISIDQVDVKQVQALISSTESNDEIGDRLAKDVRSAVIQLAIRSSLSALAGAVILSVLVFRRPKHAFAAAATALVLVAASGGIAAASFRTTALSEPKFSGLLAGAPAAIGDVQDIAARFTAYREELAKLVTNVSKLYDVASTLPSSLPAASTTTVLWVSDIHDNPEAFTVMESLVTQFHVAAVVDSGDLSDHGTALENKLYTPIATLGVPYVYVKGNHDSADQTVASIRAYKNVTVLDDTTATVAGLTFTGIGDPRFTPNKTAPTTSDQSALLSEYGARLAVQADTSHADVAVIHDPAMSQPLFGHVPLVLAGHLHRRDVQTGNGTLMLTQGSTGGAGLRGLEGAEPLPLDASVLYFDATTHQLIAYDDVTVGGLGLTSVQIQRHAVTSELKGGTNPVPPSVGPSATPPPSVLPTFAPDTSGPSGAPTSSSAAPSATPSDTG